MNRSEWNRAYDDAMAWRDWQTCDILLERREQEDWWTSNRNPGDEPNESDLYFDGKGNSAPRDEALS